MRELQLTSIQLQYIKSLPITSERIQQEIQSWYLDDREQCYIVISDDMAEELRSEFTEYLAKNGFDRTYELTKDGKVLEQLIDIFA